MNDKTIDTNIIFLKLYVDDARIHIENYIRRIESGDKKLQDYTLKELSEISLEIKLSEIKHAIEQLNKTLSILNEIQIVRTNELLSDIITSKYNIENEELKNESNIH